MTGKMIERVAEALERVKNTRAYGLYDYSSYPGELPPHVVRDEIAGKAVLRTNDAVEARTLYEKLSREFVARAAIAALPLAEWLSEWESAEAMVDQEFGLSTDPVVVNVPLEQLRELVKALKP